MKILIIGDVNNIFVRDLTNEIKKNYDVQIDILSLFNKLSNKDIMFDNLYMLSNIKFGRSKNPWLLNKLNKLTYLLAIKDMIKNLDNYDIVNIHFFNPIYSYFAKEIRSKAKVLCVSYWGSDFYRISDKEKQMQKKLLNLADTITFANSNTERDFQECYNNKFNHKTEVCRFGLKVIEEIQAYDNDDNFQKIYNDFLKKYDLEKDKLYIACGYNSTPAQQHKEIIKYVSLLNEEYRKKIVFLFPMTYGDEKYREDIERMLSLSSLNYKVFKEYMGYKEMAIFRKVSDIMIHVQRTDQFSGSMQETLYAGNIVINGKWLSYDVLKQKEAFFLEVDSISQLNDRIIYAMDNYEELKVKCKDNKKVIWELSSWQVNCKKWYSIYYKSLNKTNYY